MKGYYSDTFVLPLPDGHRFPMRKYSRLRERVVSEGIIALNDLHIPPPASDADILRCHTGEYLERVKLGQLTRREVLRIGFPWSPEMVERSRRSAGATICAARVALAEGIAVNLAGGTHHAGRDHGEGYCVFNDAAIAIRAMQAEGRIHQALVIDCDVHQGNGTADICHDDPTIYTFSIHGEKNFPFRKVPSDLDIGLPDGTSDEEYLNILSTALDRIFFIVEPQLVIYIAGADAYAGDKLGKLALTKRGMAERDRLVLERCWQERIATVVAMGGGYASDIEDIADIHVETIRVARQMAGMWPAPVSREDITPGAMP